MTGLDGSSGKQKRWSPSGTGFMPNISQTICCDRGSRRASKPSLARRPQRVPIPARRDRSPVCEKALIRNKLSRGPYPLCTGYMGTGVVEAVGSEIDNFEVGDEVYFRGNDTMALADGTSVTCVSGAHSSHIVTRPNTTHGVDHMIPGAAMDVACMFVMPAVGLYGVVRRL